MLLLLAVLNLLSISNVLLCLCHLLDLSHFVRYPCSHIKGAGVERRLAVTLPRDQVLYLKQLLEPPLCLLGPILGFGKTRPAVCPQGLHVSLEAQLEVRAPSPWRGLTHLYTVGGGCYGGGPLALPLLEQL